MKKLLLILFFGIFISATELIAAFDTSSLEETIFKTFVDRFIVAESSKERIELLGKIMKMRNIPEWEVKVRPLLLDYVNYLLETGANPEYISKISRSYINYQIFTPKLRREVIEHINRLNLSAIPPKEQKAALDLFVFLTERVKWNKNLNLWVKVGFIRDIKEIATKLKNVFVGFFAVVQSYIDTLREKNGVAGDLNVEDPEEREVLDNNNLPADDNPDINAPVNDESDNENSNPSPLT